MIRQAYLNDLVIINELIKEMDKTEITEKELNESPFTKFFVYFIDNKVVGFINYSIIYERSELNYIVVSDDFRRQNIATKLLEYMICDCINHKCNNITLEVRKDNFVAIQLYKKIGFKEMAIRKNYYGNCDGIMMERMLVKE